MGRSPLPLRGARPSWRRLLAVGPVLLLCAVAALQVSLAATQSLSPWKGGGFGMFSTIDSPHGRVLRIYLVRGDQATPIAAPDMLRSLVQAARTIPTEDRLRALAVRLAQGTWVPLEVESAPARYSSLVAEEGADRAPAGAGRYALAGLLRMLGEHESAAPDAVAFDAVRVELWKTRFDADTAELHLWKYLDLTAMAPRGAEEARP
ncbi:hypothetical protein [Nannocystis punicea]|uniref:GerMN domain-containing protein n=1 Tax=Nannocystis punicea TaxID=2995304 RepID=A0ABY7GUK4_9BACT|nr:hypothetical protein [Nannocystis poenicansa]WAS90637.1 hypothetical protein O0S08_30995 [Nannocystis poenicansa]